MQLDATTTEKDPYLRRRAAVSAGEDLRWWLEPAESMHERVWAVTKRMIANSRWRRIRNYLHTFLYNGVDASMAYQGVDAIGYGTGFFGAEFAQSRIVYNITQIVVDTAASIVGTNLPKPMFLTDGGSLEDMQKAADLTSYTGTVFRDARVYETMKRAFVDAAVCDIGAVKFWGDAKTARIECERIAPHELLVDELDGMREAPTQVHHRRHVARDVLCEMFPEHEEAIRRANTEIRSSVLARTVGDMIPVVESWHLPSAKGADDGVHAWSIETATLLCEPYERTRYPIVFWRWYPSTTGFFGRGIVAEVEEIQREISDTLRCIRESQQIAAVPGWWVNRASQVVWDQLLNNEIGRAVEFSGEGGQPQPMQLSQVLPADVYQHLWNLEQRAFQTVGISQAMSSGEKPAGVESAAAIREVADIASGRFKEVGQRWEQLFLDSAELVVDLSKELYTSNKKLAVKAREQDALREIEWKDVDMDRDRYRIEVFPVSSLPSQPAGRRAALDEMTQAGWVPKEVAMGLMDMPDLKRYTNLETGTMDLVQQSISTIKRTGKYGPDLKPIPQMNMALAKQLATMEKVLAKKQGATDVVLGLLDDYLADLEVVNAKQQQIAQQAQQPPGGAPAMPIGAPAPPMPPMPQQM